MRNFDASPGEGVGFSPEVEDSPSPPPGAGEGSEEGDEAPPEAGEEASPGIAVGEEAFPGAGRGGVASTASVEASDKIPPDSGVGSARGKVRWQPIHHL